MKLISSVHSLLIKKVMKNYAYKTETSEGIDSLFEL